MKLSTIAALCAAACGLLAPSQALAKKETTISCGMLVTESIKVANDLPGPCLPALEVAHKGITIDLNGHTVGGLIDNSDTSLGNDPNTYSDVKIKNGTILSSFRGVQLSAGADRNTIQDVDIIGGDFGIVAFGVHRLRVIDSHVSGAVITGISLLGGTTNELRNNTLTDNTGYGIFVSSGVRATKLIGNEVTGTKRTMTFPTPDGDGIHVESTDPSTVLKRNEAFFNGGYGIFAADGVTDGGHNEAGGNGGPNCTFNLHCD